MNVLYFSRDYTTHDHRILSALARTEHTVYYLRLERQGHQLEDRALPPQIEQVSWRGGRSPARLKDGPGLLIDLKRVIQKIKPDLIQAGPLQRSAFLTALTGFHPLVSTSWGYDLLHDANRNATWRWVTRYTLKRSAILIGDCNTIRKLAITYGMPDDRIVTFPWGIDLEHFSPPSSVLSRGSLQGRVLRDDKSQAPRPFNLLSTRGWEPIYGVDTIARAFVQASQQHPELRLVMLGNGSQAGLLRQILMRGGMITEQIRDSDGDQYPKVIFPGQISYADLPGYYKSSDLYIAATHSDGSSISLLEAMACSLPALVSDIPGNREWITQGENGWLFPKGDVKSLAKAISQAVDQRQRLPEMGHTARQIAERRADWNKNFQELLRAYELALRTS